MEKRANDQMQVLVEIPLSVDLPNLGINAINHCVGLRVGRRFFQLNRVVCAWFRRDIYRYHDKRAGFLMSSPNFLFGVSNLAVARVEGSPAIQRPRAIKLNLTSPGDSCSGVGPGVDGGGGGVGFRAGAATGRGGGGAGILLAISWWSLAISRNT
jgi:hypothetical protein